MIQIEFPERHAPARYTVREDAVETHEDDNQIMHFHHAIRRLRGETI